MGPPRKNGPPGHDPRLHQIGSLAGLLAYGIGALDFEVSVARAAVILAAALVTQYVGTKLAKLPAYDPRSALISGLSLCLLARTNSLGLAAATAVVAIASKFVLRWNGKHVFNPTNFGLVAMMLATGGAPGHAGPLWVSPGQWGNVAFFAFLMACVGSVVVNRAARSDVTLAFIAAWASLLFGRALWLGQPPSIPLHMLENGAFLLFAFFMISDPKTTPDSRAGRIAFALLVAAGAAFVQFVLYRTNGLLWSLAACSPLVPMLDRLLPGPRYQWQPRVPLHSPSQGVHHETLVPVPVPVRGAVARERA